MLPSRSMILAEAICTTIRPKFRVPTELFLLIAHDHSTKIYGSLSFNLSFVHDHSTKNYGCHWFISFMCTRPFDQNMWSSFIYFFFCARPFDQDLRSSLIYFFICTWPFDKYVSSSFIYSFFCLRRFDQNLGPHWFISFICKRPFDQIIWSSFVYSFFILCTTIRPKIRVLFNLFFLFVHYHSTKNVPIMCYIQGSTSHVRSVSGSSAFIFRIQYIHSSTTLMFPTLYSWKCCSYISYAISMAIWSLSPEVSSLQSEFRPGVR